MRSSVRIAACAAALLLASLAATWRPVTAAEPPQAAPPLGTAPAAGVFPRVEFAFEARVTLSPAVVLGETPRGHRQYIPITGGRIAGPKFAGEVVPGGWDFQLRLPDGCGTLTADYFWRAADGTVIHILNESYSCGPGVPGAERSFFRPRFEAPKGPHEWLNRATFVATLELEPPAAGAAPDPGAPRPPMAIRLKFFQVK